MLTNEFLIYKAIPELVIQSGNATVYDYYCDHYFYCTFAFVFSTERLLMPEEVKT